MESITSKTKGDNKTHEMVLSDPINSLNPSNSGEVQTAERSARGSD
jgi:hypothetical protein